jgi:hypothetical protein
MTDRHELMLFAMRTIEKVDEMGLQFIEAAIEAAGMTRTPRKATTTSDGNIIALAGVDLEAARRSQRRRRRP